MGMPQIMARLAKWHIWLGWLVGVPILMWLVTGLVMVVKPIEEVRGNHLLREVPEQALPADAHINVALPSDTKRPVKSVSTQVERGATVTRITYMDGTTERFLPDGSQMSPLTDVEARLIVEKGVIGGDRVVNATRFAADNPPSDFRRPVPVWQIALEDGTHVYVGTESGAIEAVRTRWWRIFDFMWGLHIMDLQTREDTSHPILILFAALGAFGALLGCVLMFRRRKSRVRVLA